MLTFDLGRREQGAQFAHQLRKLSCLVADMPAISNGVHPEELIGAQTPLLDQWALARRPAPCLVGASTGHPKLVGCNRQIVTSDLWLRSGDLTWARTLSRWYRLGRPADEGGNHA